MINESISISSPSGASYDGTESLRDIVRPRRGMGRRAKYRPEGASCIRIPNRRKGENLHAEYETLLPEERRPVPRPRPLRLRAVLHPRIHDPLEFPRRRLDAAYLRRLHLAARRALDGPEAGETGCQRRCDFVVFRRTGNVEKWRVKVYSL